MMYYVYASFYRDIMVYVGKGKGSRLNHTLNGESANKVLNEFYFRTLYFNDFPLETRKLQHFKNEKDALSYEKSLILKNQPIGNRSCGLQVESGLSMSLTKKLRKLLNDETLDSNIITSFYNEDLIYTPYGLPCTFNCKELPNFLTLCQNGNIKLSEAVLENFPTKASKFLYPKIKIETTIFNNETFSEVFNDLKNCNKLIQTKDLSHNCSESSILNMEVNLASISKVGDKVSKASKIDYASMRQIKWTDKIRLILLRKGFPDDFEDAFGYIQLSKFKGYYFTRKELVGVNSLTLTGLSNADLSGYVKSRVPF